MWNDHDRFPCSLLFGQRVRHPAIPLRLRHGYAVDIHRGLPTQAKQTRSGVLRPLWRTDTHRSPAHIHRVRAGNQSRGVTTPVSLVYLPVSLTGPDPSGSARPARLRRGCSHPPRQLPAPVASSFTPPLRRQGDGGLSPPSETTAPHGARSRWSPTCSTPRPTRRWTWRAPTRCAGVARR